MDTLAVGLEGMICWPARVWKVCLSPRDERVAVLLEVLLSSLLYLARFCSSALFQYLIHIPIPQPFSSGTLTRLFLAPWTSSLAGLPEPDAIEASCVVQGIATELHETTREPSPPLRDTCWEVA